MTLRATRSALVPVLEVDPDLASALDTDETTHASRILVASERMLDAGPWKVGGPPHGPGTFGLLLTRGVVSGTTDVHGRCHTELLGPGDLLQPWAQIGEEASIVPALRWQVLAASTVLMLDRRFAVAAARWPEIAAALMNRLVVRARRLSFQMAASSLPRTTERLLLMLWHFAERWGRMTPDGVVLELPITHMAMAEVIGTRRPSVTTALGELRDSGQLVTRGHGEWVLRPPAPSTFAELRAQVGLPDMALRG